MMKGKRQKGDSGILLIVSSLNQVHHENTETYLPCTVY